MQVYSLDVNELMSVNKKPKETLLQRFLLRVKNTRAAKASIRNAKAVEILGMKRLYVGICMSIDRDIFL